MTPEQLALRQCVLAVCVLDDVDLEPRDDGVHLPGAPGGTAVHVRWAELQRALGGPTGGVDALGVDAASLRARRLVSSWLRLRRALADVSGTSPGASPGASPGTSLAELGRRVRPVGLPHDHALHPGRDWVREDVAGGALGLGIGLLGVLEDPDRVQVVPQGVLEAAGIDLTPWWAEARNYLERMGSIAAQRLVDQHTDSRGQAPESPLLRPIGDCDVVTLLGSRALRAALCAMGGTGLRAAAVPMRRRGWLDLTRIDPAFAIAAAAATDEAERGFPRPLLLTVDEVTLVPPGGRPAELVLRDPAAPDPNLPDVRYR